MIRYAAGLLLTLVMAVAAVPLSAHDELGFVGTLTKVDIAKNSITLKYRENGKDELAEIALTPKTQITRDKKAVPRSTLKAGMSVAVKALGCEGEDLEAVEIRIVPPAPAKK